MVSNIPGLGRLLATGVLTCWAVTAAGQDERAAQALEFVNAARAAEGLDALTLDDRLIAAAEVHAEDMRARDYYAHVSPEGGTVRDRYLAEDGSEWRLVAENIAMCEGCPTPPGPERIEAFHAGWMESPDHRETILDPGLETFGFAMTWGEGVTFGVQTFAGPGRPEGLAPGEPEVALPPEALSTHALEVVNRAREAGELAPLKPSAAFNAAATDLTDAGAVDDAEGALSAALDAAGGAWSSVAMAAGECGGCGTAPTAADAEHFIADWLAEPALAEAPLAAEAESFGFALTANGEGRKGAVLLTGRH